MPKDREGDKKATHEIVKNRESKEVEKHVLSSVDADGAWIRKAGKLRYGYKEYHVTDEEDLVLGVVTTATNVNDISKLEAVLQRVDLPENIPMKVAKGCPSKKNSDLCGKQKGKEKISQFKNQQPQYYLLQRSYSTDNKLPSSATVLIRQVVVAVNSPLLPMFFESKRI